MDNLDKALHRLSKVNPDEGFIKASKTRLMSKIQAHSHPDWTESYFQEGAFDPSESFIAQARVRLMAQIKALPKAVQAPLHGLGLFFRWTKRILASTFVMFVAVTVVLFQLEGGQVVQASNDSYLEMVSGTASVRSADALVWNEIKGQIDIHAGDLIKVEPDSQAVIHFFDGTEVRLNESTGFLISQLAFSPAYENQAMIETSLESGEAWVQTLNVDDGYANFTMVTREGVLRALNASFNVKSPFDQPTEVSVFKGSTDISLFDPSTGQRVRKTRLTQDKYAMLDLDAANQPNLTEGELALAKDEWIAANLNEDQKHLAQLRQEDYNRLALMTGSLPGDALYSIKRAKESLRLAFSDDQDLSIKIDIANHRLNESILLFEKGKIREGKEALLAYQTLAQQIVQAKKALAQKQPSDSNATPADKLIAQLVVPHQKMLAVQPTNKNSLTVKEILKKTAEHLAENPLELENIRLKNSIASLQDINALIESGQVDLAKEKLAQYKMASVQVAVLDDLSDEAKKRDAYQEALNMRQEEADLLAIVSEKTISLEEGNEEILAMTTSASQEVAANAEEIRQAALPLMPELTEEVVNIEPLNPLEIKAKLVAEKINIYVSWDGQWNEIQRLLGDDLNNVDQLEFLKLVKGFLQGRAQNYLATRILQLQNKIASTQTVPSSSPAPVVSTPTTDPVAITAEPVQDPEVAAANPTQEADPVGETTATADAPVAEDPTEAAAVAPTEDPTQETRDSSALPQ